MGSIAPSLPGHLSWRDPCLPPGQPQMWLQFVASTGWFGELLGLPWLLFTK